MSINLKIKANHVELTPALEQYAISKLTKVKNTMNKITSINVILSIDNRDRKAEAEIRIAGDQHSIFAEATTDSMYKSIDALEDKLLKQVIKYNEILKKHD